MNPPNCCLPADIESAICGEDAEFARLAAALGHPARVAIVRLLLQRGTCICGEIVGVLPLSQSTVSQHLKVLKDAGWIRCELDGPRSCYGLNAGAAQRFQTMCAQFLAPVAI